MPALFVKKGTEVFNATSIEIKVEGVKFFRIITQICAINFANFV